MIARMTGIEDVTRALNRFRREAMDEMRDGVKSALDGFHVEFASNRLQMRKKDSVGVRSGGLLKSLSTEAKSASGGVLGRVYFKGGTKIQTIAQTQQHGATIRPKRKKYLKFRVFRKYSRRGWNHPKPFRWVQVKKVTVPPRLNFYQDWKRYEPAAFRILEKARDKAVAKARPMFS